MTVQTQISPANPVVTLTQGQKDGAESFFSFLMNDDAFFVLSGGAGVGKTFLMGYLVDSVLDDYQDACRMIGKPVLYDQVSFTATTNKAAEVLEKSIKKPVKTIHSFLGLKVTEDFRTGKTFLKKTNQWKERRGEILFIDEASMVDPDLFKLILESMPFCKIIFVGDHAQMAPVSCDLSPVFETVTEDNFVFLDEPVRNAGTPALVSLCSQLRNTVETGVFKPIAEVPGVVDYLDNDQMQRELHSHFLDPDPSCRVLCYTNTRVQQFNDYIRQDVRQLPAEIQVGDILVVAQTSMCSQNKTLNVEREVKVMEIGEIQDSKIDPSIFPDQQPLLYRNVTIGLQSGSRLIQTIRLPLEQDRATYAKRHFAKQKEWAHYFEIKNLYADLRDKAACTVYKAQGSTYDTVFIDLGNIGTSYDSAQVARMLFVAVSRARSRVCFFGQLPGRYINSHP